jgi:hypothetical protein
MTPACLARNVALVVLALPLSLSAAQALLPSSGATLSPTASPSFSVELRRGFNAATYAVRDRSHSETWLENFERVLRVGEHNQTNSSAFVLGAQFGFSYRIAEFERCDQTLSWERLRRLAIWDALARLKSEKRKRALGATDADLVRILGIPISSFAAWKGGVATSDHDTTVVDSSRWLLI